MPEAAMTQNSSSEGADTAEAGSGSRALVIARDLRGKSLRARQQRRLLFVLIVLGTLVAALAWGAFVVKPRYAAEARFSVRGSGGAQAAASPAASLLAGGAGGASGAGFVDGYAVNDFLKSRDSMQQLRKRIDLPALLGVAPDAGAEALYKAYTAAISAKFNMVEQENVLEVRAFSPDGSRSMAEALLVQAQDFVSTMDAQGVQNTLDADARQLHKAEDEAMRAANAVAAWRTHNRNVDPEAETTLVMTMIGQIEQELNTARINYAKVRALQNLDHPMLRPAQMQVAALENQLAQMRGRLVAGGSSQAALLQTYSQLKNAQTFADNNLTAARDAYQQAYHDMTRLRRYLGVIVRPIASDVPSSPSYWVLAIEGLLAGALLAFLASLAIDLLRPNRP